MGLSNDLSCEAGSLSCCRPNTHGLFQSEFSGFISPCWSPGLQGLLRSPPFFPVYLCESVVPRDTTHHSACPVLRHSESGPSCLSAQMWGHRVCQWSDCMPRSSHTLPVSVPPWPRESSLPRCPSLPLLPVLMYVSFLCFYLLSEFLAVRFFCQFWLCKEAQCVYLCHHLGSPRGSVLCRFNIMCSDSCLHF